MSHNFFDSIDWIQLIQKQITPPFIPDMQNVDDVKYIEEDFLN
jgi:hypothetical protein